jgi:transposase
MGVAPNQQPLGRPAKLTPELQNKICDAIRAGNYLETAAAFAGIGKSTFYDWLRRGQRVSKGIYHDFSEAVEKALADSEARDVALIAKAAADGQWQAAAWRLERKFPDRWGRRDRHQVEANIQGTVKVTSDEAIEELTRLLAARTPRDGEAKDPASDDAGGD